MAKLLLDRINHNNRAHIKKLRSRFKSELRNFIIPQTRLSKYNNALGDTIAIIEHLAPFYCAICITHRILTIASEDLHACNKKSAMDSTRFVLRRA